MKVSRLLVVGGLFKQRFIFISFDGCSEEMHVFYHQWVSSRINFIRSSLINRLDGPLIPTPQLPAKQINGAHVKVIEISFTSFVESYKRLNLKDHLWHEVL